MWIIDHFSSGARVIPCEKPHIGSTSAAENVQFGCAVPVFLTNCLLTGDGAEERYRFAGMGNSAHMPSRHVPTGRFNSSPSTINGELLRWFTPFPLSSLVAPWRRDAVTVPVPLNLSERFALTRLACVRGDREEVDLRAAACMVDAFLGRAPLRNSQDLLRMGKAIDAKSSAWRDEMIFSGAMIPSRARQIFAPTSELPGLLEDIEPALRGIEPGTDALRESAIIGFFLSYAHPFQDGNGRAARTAAVAVARVAGDVGAGLSYAVMHNHRKRALTRVLWPRAKSEGLEQLMDAVSRFHSLFAQRMERSEQRRVLIRISELIDRTASRRVNVALRLHSMLWLESGLSEAAIRQVAGCSAVIARTLSENLAEVLGGSGPSGGAKIQCDRFCDSLQELIPTSEEFGVSEPVTETAV